MQFAAIARDSSLAMAIVMMTFGALPARADDLITSLAGEPIEQTVERAERCVDEVEPDLPSRSEISTGVEDLLLSGGSVDRAGAPGGLESGVTDFSDAEPTRIDPAPSTTTPLELVWPLQGVLTSRYGRRGRGHHSGLDIAASRGTIIVAAASGRVVRAGSGWGRYGKLVLIDHGGGFATLYAHASKVFVKVGDVITRGTAIAAVGRSGNATGPHLHFEVWGGDRALDPLRFLGQPAQTAQLAGSR